MMCYHKRSPGHSFTSLFFAFVELRLKEVYPENTL